MRKGDMMRMNGVLHVVRTSNEDDDEMMMVENHSTGEELWLTWDHDMETWVRDDNMAEVEVVW